jgi:hypothetical protein
MADSDRNWDRFRGWIVPVAVAVVTIGLVIVAINQSPQAPTSSVSPSASASAVVVAGQHDVVTDQGTVSIAEEAGVIVVRLTDAGGSHELARAGGEATASGHAPPSGATGYIMSCSQTGGEPRRYVFGKVAAGSRIELAGSDAAGQGASDGLFLFALTAGSSADLTISVDGRKQLAYRSTAFDALLRVGTRQESGCLVA